jgi:cytochrome b6-f complex iron-sulfur subunit
MAEATAPASPPLTRREFLMYTWIASLALASAGTGGAILWFAYPRFRIGEFGGEFPINVSALPAVGTEPEDHPEGRFWLVNTENGLVALYKVCVHLGCLYKWVPSNNRFECPCHGSKYQPDGQYIEGPAPRSLDRFVIRALDADGAVIAETAEGDLNADDKAGQPIAIPDGAVEIRIATGDKITGPQHA